MGASEELRNIVDQEVTKRFITDIAEILRRNFEEGKGPGGMAAKIHDPCHVLEKMGLLKIRHGTPFDYWNFLPEAQTWYARLKAEGFYEKTSREQERRNDAHG